MKVMLTTDGNPAAIHAISVAITELNMHQAQVLLVSVLEPGLHVGGNLNADADLQEGLELLAKAGIRATPELLRGDYVDCILAKAEAYDPDVIVMGSSHNSRWARALMGSVSAEVTRRSRHPVLVVPYKPDGHKS